MPDSNAINVLKNEHRGIERMLAILDAVGERLEHQQPVRPELLADCVDFLQNFADKCHHQKEEGSLFPLMEARGMPREMGPMACMLFEHDEARALLSAIGRAIHSYEAGDAESARIITENATAYTGLLRHHIMVEDNVLYRLAEQLLSAADQEQLAEGFERMEAEVMGPGVHERYHEILDRLEQELGLTHPV